MNMLMRFGVPLSSASMINIISLTQEEMVKSECNEDSSKEMSTGKGAAWKRKGWWKSEEGVKPNIFFILTLKADLEHLNQRYYYILIISLAFRITHHLMTPSSSIPLQCFVVNTTGALSLQIRKFHQVYLPKHLTWTYEISILRLFLLCYWL